MLIVWWCLPAEPTWKGKTLSSWIRGFVGEDAALESATMEAVRAMGTKVVPQVRAELRSTDNPFKLMLIRLSRKQKLIRFPFRTAAELHEEACMVYSFVDRPVKGQLVKDWIEFVESGGPDALRVALMAHGGRGERGFGPEALEPLLQALNNTNTPVRILAVVWLKCVPERAELVVPALIQAMNDSKLEVRGAAALSLGILGREPEVAIPALLKGVSDPEPIMRHRCIGALGCFTNDAPSLLSTFQAALQDPEPHVRAEAKRILKNLGGVAPLP